MRPETRRLTVCALLASVAILMGWVERLISFDTGVPGIKPGLANLVILLILYTLDTRAALAINVVRILAVGLLFTGASALLYSLVGGLLSFAVMWLCKRAGCFSMVGVSMAGGVAHNTGQLLAALPLMRSPALLYYLPILILGGALAGVLVGVLATLLLPTVRRALAVQKTER